MFSGQIKQKKLGKRFSIKKAHALQLRMSTQIIRQDTLPNKIRYVAGIDIAYTKEFSISAAVVLEYHSLSHVETKTAQTRTCFPYIPTLLSFREIPPAYSVAKKLHSQTDIFLVDGQGIMHPYRLGFASHLGLILGKPTIGVAKKPLLGEIGEPNEENWAPITHKEEVIGAELKTRKGMKPIYVSIGHMISLIRAIKIVKHCTPTYRIPKPTRLAHTVAKQEKRKVQKQRFAKERLVEYVRKG